MISNTVSKVRLRAVRKRAMGLLRSPNFFPLLLEAVEKEGLVGEQRNALVLFIIAVSRLLPRPLNALVKGQSSSGKNWLVGRVLRLLPKNKVREITSSSDTAWNYEGSSFKHRIVYIPERNEATGSMHPARLLISEGRLVRLVTSNTRWRGTEKYVTKGPIACISTTTKSQLSIDDESRHVSLYIDESPDQTRRIVQAQLQGESGLDEDELAAWREVQRVIEENADLPIRLPAWVAKIAGLVSIPDIRVRRYFPAFLQACRAVCLIRQFQTDHRGQRRRGELEITFADFAITTIVFERVFTETLSRPDEEIRRLTRILRRICKRNRNKSVTAEGVADHLRISKQRAYALLRRAVTLGVARRANRPEQMNRKRFVPAKRRRFIPDPMDVYSALREIEETASFVHPITGASIVYEKRKK